MNNHKLKNSDATLGLTGIIAEELRVKLTEILTQVGQKAIDLYEAKKYIAIEETIIEGMPEDLGTIRAAASYNYHVQYNQLYMQNAKLGKPNDDVEPIHPDSIITIDVVVNVPAFGQMRAYARIKPGQGKLLPQQVHVQNEGSVGTLWFTDALDVLRAVLATNLLANPTFEKTLESW